MGVVIYNINKMNLLNTLKFPTKQYNKDYTVYRCNEREWILPDNRNIFHYYKNYTENYPCKKFDLVYADTENLEEYYKEYPISKKTT